MSTINSNPSNKSQGMPGMMWGFPHDQTGPKDEKVGAWDDPQILVETPAGLVPLALRSNRYNLLYYTTYRIVNFITIPPSVSGWLTDLLCWVTIGGIVVQLGRWMLVVSAPLFNFFPLILIVFTAAIALGVAYKAQPSCRPFVFYRLLLMFVACLLP